MVDYDSEYLKHSFRRDEQLDRENDRRERQEKAFSYAFKTKQQQNQFNWQRDENKFQKRQEEKQADREYKARLENDKAELKKQDYQAKIYNNQMNNQTKLAINQSKLEHEETKALQKSQLDYAIVEREMASTLQQMGLSHEQQKEFIGLYLEDWINRQNVEEQRARYEHERDLEQKFILHQQYLEMQKEEQEHQLYIAQVESLLTQIVETRRHKQQKALKEQEHSQSCEYDKVQTDNQIRLEFEKAKIRLWEKVESRKLDKAMTDQWRAEYENDKKFN